MIETIFEIENERGNVSAQGDGDTLHLAATHAEEMLYVAAPMHRDEVRELRDALTVWLGESPEELRARVDAQSALEQAR